MTLGSPSGTTAVPRSAASGTAARRTASPAAAARALRVRALAACCALCLAGAPLLGSGPAARAEAVALDAPAANSGDAPADDALRGPGVQVGTRSGAPAPPAAVSALSWLVADARTGDVLAARDAHRELPPASTLKTLFALTLLPAFPAAVRHTVTPRELAGIGPGSSLAGVAAGRTYRVSDLWNGVFLSSGNDAVRVLSAMNGGPAAVSARMQATARALGARDTHVLSPDGYDAPGQVSSAYDLAVFARAGLADPEFARYAATVRARFPGGGRPYEIQNTNRLLTGVGGVAPYPGLVGVKNGYTSHAGHTLVAAARRKGRTLIVTVLNPRKGGGSTVYEEARALLDWGFAAAGHVDPVGSLEPRRGGPPADARVPTPGPLGAPAFPPVAPARPPAPLPSGPPAVPSADAAAGTGDGDGDDDGDSRDRSAVTGTDGVIAGLGLGCLGAGVVALALRARRARSGRD
ncbi:D-alanyl-D-alanine carboxypeptidase family protein [Streptomyces minutiscleroticus]|nr:serine hydrolase [Streptomyces minutiscleroticus]